MKNQTISLQGMKEIHDCACSDWKKKIKNMTDPFNDTVLTSKTVEEMFSAASADQAKVLSKWLKKPGYDITSWQDIVDRVGEVELPYKNPKNKIQKSANALINGAAIAEAFNDGTEMDWNNRDQYKYQPYKYWSVGRWVIGYCRWFDFAGCVSALCFKSRDLAIKAYELFPEVYDDYYMV